ncbi:DUF3703 domain-containing protein [Polaribacter sp. IC073]|uniref:DUF3703 domain-containing protein n=1 Tax=Polaribacter sp. IC073 TaxID=2508540 RepID=UPI0011BDB5BA|nr:DUF3703 domain-containing protein [Polaribacter sp. IC073]TXD49256.1 DUF3703 domain-containing protein [Polaribacter sp. IC073]
MTFNFKITKYLKSIFKVEYEMYEKAMGSQNLELAWYHLERLHIVGQSYPFEHTYSHWLMLKFGFRLKNIKEVFGQVIRLLVGGWKSFINQIPKGNTGGSNVHPLKKMELPNDLKLVFKYYKK